DLELREGALVDGTVLAALAVEAVVAGAALHDVVAVARGDVVVAGAAVELEVARRTFAHHQGLALVGKVDRDGGAGHVVEIAVRRRVLGVRDGDVVDGYAAGRGVRLARLAGADAGAGAVDRAILDGDAGQARR